MRSCPPKIPWALPLPGRVDPDEGAGLPEELANNAAAEVTGGSGDEDGAGGHGGLFSTGLARTGRRWIRPLALDEGYP